MNIHHQSCGELPGLTSQHHQLKSDSHTVEFEQNKNLQIEQF